MQRINEETVFTKCGWLLPDDTPSPTIDSADFELPDEDAQCGDCGWEQFADAKKLES